MPRSKGSRLVSQAYFYSGHLSQTTSDTRFLKNILPIAGNRMSSSMKLLLHRNLLGAAALSKMCDRRHV